MNISKELQEIENEIQLSKVIRVGGTKHLHFSLCVHPRINGNDM